MHASATCLPVSFQRSFAYTSTVLAACGRLCGGRFFLGCPTQLGGPCITKLMLYSNYGHLNFWEREMRLILKGKFWLVSACVFCFATSGVAEIIERPHSNTGRACLDTETLPAKKSTSTREYAEQCDGGFCWDLMYQFKATNVCSQKIEFKWRFPGSRLTTWNQRSLAPGASTVVGCEKNLQRCDGQIQYDWFMYAN